MRLTLPVGGLALLALTALAPRALANPRALPFTYPYETLPQGEAEIEQYVDMSPTKATFTSATPTSTALFLFQTEYEYGITDRLELGLYVQFAPSTPGSNDAGAIDSNGVKQRLRLRLMDEGKLPIDMSIYGEVVETQTEIEIEAKLNLQKRFGRLRVMSNLWVEHEFYFDHRNEWVLNPTLGLTYQVTPLFNTGVESWMRWEIPATEPAGPRPFALAPHVFVGPAVMLNFGKIWWSNGFYFRVSDATRPIEAGDTFGHVWYRMVIGVSL